MSFSLKNKVVFITCASSGIGYSSAIEFAKLGAKLIITARRKDRLEALAKKLKDEHSVDVLALELDVSNKESVFSIIESLEPKWAEIAVLVNNAGLALDIATLQGGDVDNWDTMIDTNIKGLLYVTRAILPGMIERDLGHILNVSSVAGYDYYRAGNVYSATKHAVKAISKSLRLDLSGTPIRVTDIAPGAVSTEFTRVRINDEKKSDEFYGSFEALLPEDIADAIAYCATRPSAYGCGYHGYFSNGTSSIGISDLQKR